MMMNKPIEFWVALMAAIAFVANRNKSEPFITRIVIAGISGGLGFSLSAEMSEWWGKSEILVVILLTALGYIALEVLVAIVADKDLMIDFIRKQIGKGGK